MRTGLCYMFGRNIGRAKIALNVAESFAHELENPKAAAQMLREAQRALNVMGDLDAIIRGKKKFDTMSRVAGERAGDLAHDLEKKKPIKNIEKRFSDLSHAVDKLHSSARKSCGYAQEHRR